MKNKFLDPLMADLGLIKEAAGNPDEVSGLVDALREGSITVDDLSEEQLDAIGATLDAADASEEKQAAEAAQYVQAMGEEIGKVAYQEFRKIAAMETVTPEVVERAVEILVLNELDPAEAFGPLPDEETKEAAAMETVKAIGTKAKNVGKRYADLMTAKSYRKMRGVAKEHPEAVANELGKKTLRREGMKALGTMAGTGAAVGAAGAMALKDKEEKKASDALNDYIEQAALELLTNLGYERQE